MARDFSSLKTLDVPVKVLFTGYLTTVAVGYLFALIQILFTHGMADGKFGLSIDDIVYSYYGNRSGSTLEVKLNGSMKENASEQERFLIMQWVRDGADQDDYVEDGIEKIIQERCVMCHNKDAAIPNFNEFEVLKELAKEDTGATFSSLTRVSHIHLFGISFILFFIGKIFLLCDMNIYVKRVAIVIPFVAMLLDVGSWFVTKHIAEFAYIVVLSGALMGLSMGVQIILSIYQMWFYRRN